ncbi:MAG TPA: type II toxin-antitoxin system RelE/ParE family toxin [Thermoanaerobaculia bacterium]
MKFKVAARADRQIRVASAWWARNRPYAPRLFAEDLESAFDLVEQFPHAGEAVPHRRIIALRRVLLSHVQYFLYYTVHTDARVVEILALWHSSRGAPPHL